LCSVCGSWTIRPRLAGPDGGEEEGANGDLLSGDNIAPYIYLIDALCEFSKILLSHPVPQAVPEPRQEAATAYATRVYDDGPRRRKNNFPVN